MTPLIDTRPIPATGEALPVIGCGGLLRRLAGAACPMRHGGAGMPHRSGCDDNGCTASA